MKHELCQGDCELWLHQLRDDPITCIFADIPDNIGLSYEAYDDKLPDAEYLQQVDKWLRLFVSKAPTVWLSFNARWTIDIGAISAAIRDELEVEVKPCVQVFSFGQHNHNDLGNCHRPLWRFQRSDARLYPDAIRVPSWRQLNGDKRADSRGRVPGDWIQSELCNRDTLPIPDLSPSDIKRFMDKVDVKSDTECWEWIASKRDGYGRFRLGDKLYASTRVMWRLHKGSDPIGQLLLHTCDNPGCCNPNHLFLGTDADNNADKEKKGRGNHPKGKDNGLSKLTEGEVLEIFQSPDSATTLARRYGVTDVNINSIKQGKTWQHVTSKILSDVFAVPRVTGNSKQRRKWHPTQLGEDLVERCIKLTTAPGDWVVDPFGGTGTTLRVCRRINRCCTIIEVDTTYCDKIASEHGMEMREKGRLSRWFLEEEYHGEEEA